ncbi:MAG: hypothetical protein ACJ77A_03505 [Actinomycetota bacterium]
MTKPMPLGGQVTPLEALRRAAGFLTPPYEVSASGPHHVALHAPGEGLPPVTLRLEKDRRLFSRTFALVVEASAPGHRSGADTSATLEWKGLRRRRILAGAPGEDDAWARRLRDEGLLDGVEAMTNVVSLEARWDASRGTARLRLATLAGAMIGTTPTSSVAVPMEPEDVRGLLLILRSLSGAASAPGS